MSENPESDSENFQEKPGRHLNNLFHNPSKNTNDIIETITRSRKIQAIGLILSLVISCPVFASGTKIDFNSIPKTGTILIYAHMDDELIWMLPWWNKTQKFINGVLPTCPTYKAFVHQQQIFLDSGGYGINYESNWMTPWGNITDKEYTEYYGRNNPAYKYLETDYLIAFWDDSDNQLVEKEIDKIKSKLEPCIASSDTQRIVTHNNWGEYGHQHHKALNKAVRRLAVKYCKDVWMLGCDNGDFIDVPVPDGITYTTASFNTPDLFVGIRNIYKNYGAWTWYDSVPSGDHNFIKIVDAGIDRSNLLTGEKTGTEGPAIKANGSTNDITINSGDNLSITVQLDPGDYEGTGVDWWVVVCANGSWFYMDGVAGWTQEGAWHPVYQGALGNLPATEVLNITDLATGSYTFWFAVDWPMDGILGENKLVDSVNVTRLSTPVPCVKANGITGELTVNYPEPVTITVEMDARAYVGVPADWWVLLRAESGSAWYYMDSVAGWTQEGAWRPVYQGALGNLPATEILNINGLATGLYTFYFAVDCPMNGILNEEQILADSVNVIVP